MAKTIPTLQVKTPTVKTPAVPMPKTPSMSIGAGRYRWLVPARNAMATTPTSGADAMDDSNK